MKLLTILLIPAAAALLLAQADTTLQKAIRKETVEGDLKGAIQQYKQIIAQKGTSKEVMAKALVRLGEAYEKQGSAEARQYYERVVREFADQGEAAQLARTRLSSGNLLSSPGKALHQVCSGADCAGSQVSPDGRYLAFSLNGNISVRDLTNGQVRQLSNFPAGTRTGGLEWAPDSKRIAYFTTEAGPQAVVLNLDGSGSRTIYRGGDAYGWSGDGKRVLVGSITRPGDPVKLAWVNVADGTVQQLPTSGMSLDLASVSPDGRYIAFNASKDKDAEENVYVMASDGSGETPIALSRSYQEPVGWSPDGKSLLYAQYGDSTTLWAVPVANGKAQGSPVVVVKDFGSDQGVAILGVTNAGTLFYRILTTTSSIYTASMDPVTGKVTSSPQLVPTTLSTKSVLPRWSPDSTKLLYGGSRPNNRATAELHVVSLSSSQDERIAESVAIGGDGYCWTRDGSSILVNSNVVTAGAPLRNEAVRVDLSTGAAKPLFPGVNLRMRTCSDSLIAARVGRSVVTRNLQTGAQGELYQLDAAATANHGIPVISHNGSSVAFLTAIDAQTSALITVPTSGGASREIARLKAPAELQVFYGFAWSPDDRYVYFVKRPDSHSPHELCRVPASGGAEESMGLKAMDIRDLDIAPDGRHVAFSIGASQQSEIWSMENFLPTMSSK